MYLLPNSISSYFYYPKLLAVVTHLGYVKIPAMILDFLCQLVSSGDHNIILKNAMEIEKSVDI